MDRKPPCSSIHSSLHLYAQLHFNGQTHGITVLQTLALGPAILCHPIPTRIFHKISRQSQYNTKIQPSSDTPHRSSSPRVISHKIVCLNHFPASPVSLLLQAPPFAFLSRHRRSKIYPGKPVNMGILCTILRMIWDIQPL